MLLIVVRSWDAISGENQFWTCFGIARFRKFPWEPDCPHARECQSVVLTGSRLPLPNMQKSLQLTWRTGIRLGYSRETKTSAELCRKEQLLKMKINSTFDLKSKIGAGNLNSPVRLFS